MIHRLVICSKTQKVLSEEFVEGNNCEHEAESLINSRGGDSCETFLGDSFHELKFAKFPEDEENHTCMNEILLNAKLDQGEL